MKRTVKCEHKDDVSECAPCWAKFIEPETQLTLQELNEILLQLQFSHAYADNSEPYLTNQRKLARTQILALFSSHIEALGLACPECRVRMEEQLNNGGTQHE